MATRKLSRSIDHKIAMAAGRDAANKRMRLDGRSVWTAADFEHALKVTTQLLQQVDVADGGLADLVEA